MIRKIVELRLPAMATIKKTRQTMMVANTLGVMMLIKVENYTYDNAGYRSVPTGLSANYDATESVLFPKAIGPAFLQTRPGWGHFIDAGRLRSPRAGLVERSCPRC